MAQIKLSFQNDFKIDERFGKYPTDWVLHRMGDLGDFYGGATPSTQQSSYWNGSINWLVPSDISTLPEEQKYIYDTSDKITDVGLAACSTVLLPAGTVTMSSRATLGDCVIFGKEMCTNQGFISCKCNDHINNEYLLYWIRQYKNYISRYAAGTTFLEIGRRQFKKLRIAIPEPQEQALIVGTLADIDRAIEVTRKAIDQAGLVKKALTQNLLSGRLKPDGTWRKPNEFYIDEKFGSVPIDWQVLKLKDIGKFTNGVNFKAEQMGTGKLFVNLDDIFRSKIIDCSKLERVNVNNTQNLQLIPGDLVFVRSSVKLEGIGLPALFSGHTEDIIFCGFVIRYRFDQEKVSPKFLLNLLLSEQYRRKTISLGQIAANTNISQKALGGLRISIPKDYQEQNQIANELYQIDNLIEIKHSKIYKLEKLKKSLMQNLLTGKIRVQAG